MSRTEYKVAGKSNTKPENLPEGLQVEETSVPHDELKIYTTGFTTIRMREVARLSGEPVVEVAFEGLGQTVRREVAINVARTVGKWLIEVADSHEKTGLREAKNVSGSVWYEIQPEWFVTAGSRESAERLAEGFTRTTFGWSSLDKLKADYPDLTVTYS